eukprot:COSAG01_NODE_4898_length_4644_cov_14.434763_5_plen_83_part_00
MPTDDENDEHPVVLTLILAVHSHCPLAEFVSRAPRPRLCISLPCCGQCGIVDEGVEPLMSWEDTNIMSPSRRLIVHFEPKLN